MASPFATTALSIQRFGFLCVVLLLIVPNHAFAATCLPGGNRSLERLLERIDDDPMQALMLIKARISKTRDRTQRAYLLGAEATALGLLSRNDEAAAAARSGRELLTKDAVALRDALIILETSNSFHLSKAAQDLPLLRAIIGRYPVNSELHACAAGTAGDLERRAGNLAQAAHYLFDAYRETRGRTDGRLAANTAHLLFKLVADVGDDTTALALNASALAYYTPRSARAKIVLLRVFRARLLNKRGNFAAGLRLAKMGEVAMRGRGDKVGDAYRALEICRSLVGLGQLSDAGRQCTTAHHVFATTSESASAQTDILRARIALASGAALAAIRLLDPVIAGPMARSSSVDISDAFLLRAEANHRMGRNKAAFADLQEHASRYRKFSEAARARQTVVTGVWLSRDQQIMRASIAEARLARESLKVAHWLGRVRLLIITGALVLVMLTALIILGARHRRHLLAVALADPLTGLPNRRGIIQQAEEAMGEAVNSASSVSIALVDLDHFKLINDTHGHAGGDAVLQAFARAATTILPPSAAFGRWGGEEFLGVFPDSTAIDAAILIERLREAVRDGMGTGIPIRFSAGIAECRPQRGTITCDDLIALADAAAYQAKADGRDRSCFAGQEMLAALPSSLRPHAYRIS